MNGKNRVWTIKAYNVNGRYLSSKNTNGLYQVYTILSTLQEGQYTVEEENGGMVLSMENVPLSGRLHDATVKTGNDYLLIRMAVKSEEGELLRNVLIEAGIKKSGEGMLMMLDYENAGALSSTCRYLIHAMDDKAESLFTRTLGETMEIRFNMTKWLEGTEYEWYRTLLFPEE